MPFLKGLLLFPGSSKKLKHKAKIYDFKHSIMNYQIFITVKERFSQTHSQLNWHSRSEIQELNPSSLIKKVLDF